MKNYAIIENGTVVNMATASAGWAPAGIIAIESDTARIGDSYASGIFTAPAQSAAQLWAAYQAQADAVLSVSDITILRCAENQIAVPATWASYRKALRAIVGASSGTPGTLPAAPAYPAGT